MYASTYLILRTDTTDASCIAAELGVLLQVILGLQMMLYYF